MGQLAISQDLNDILSVDARGVTSDLDRTAYRKMGMRVWTAKNFNTVEKHLLNRDISLILINLDQLNMDGVSLVEYLKKHKKYKDIPVVAASVQTGRLRRKANAAGVDEYIEQPIPRDLFIEKVKSFLSQATRTSDRVATSFDAELKYSDELVLSTVLDISPTGILVETDFRTEADAAVQIKMKLPGLKRAFILGAQVVRQEDHKTETGYKTALRFNSISTEAKRKIEKFVLQNKMQGELKYYM